MVSIPRLWYPLTPLTDLNTSVNAGLLSFCEGSLVAATIAAHPGDLKFFINISGSPWELLPVALRNRCTAVPIPTFHCLGDTDELFSAAELYSIPSRCRQATIRWHTGGHIVPPLMTNLRDEVERFAFGALSMEAPLRTNGVEAAQDQFDSMQLLQTVRRGHHGALDVNGLIKINSYAVGILFVVSDLLLAATCTLIISHLCNLRCSSFGFEGHKNMNKVASCPAPLI